MRSGLILAAGMAILAASYTTSPKPAVTERQASNDAAPVQTANVCEDVEAFGLGSHAGKPLEIIVDELARLAALLGVNDALPHLTDMRYAAASGDPLAEATHIAAEGPDRHSFEICGIRSSLRCASPVRSRTVSPKHRSPPAR